VLAGGWLIYGGKGGFLSVPDRDEKYALAAEISCRPRNKTIIENAPVGIYFAVNTAPKPPRQARGCGYSYGYQASSAAAASRWIVPLFQSTMANPFEAWVAKTIMEEAAYDFHPALLSPASTDPRGSESSTDIRCLQKPPRCLAKLLKFML
jgi:hypothetical protein